MMIRFFFLTILFTSLIYLNALAQEMPYVYDVENTGASYPTPYLPSFNELPAIKALPDPFEWADGRGRIMNFSDWEYRRHEISAQIQKYEIGEKPVRPDSITASFADGTLTVNVFVNDKTLTLTCPVTVPDGDGPFPAVIGMNNGTGSLPAGIFTSRHIATIAYFHNQVTTYSSPQNTDPYYQLYPNLDIDNTGQYSAWAWGVSRIIDGLERVQNVLPIDLKHLAVTGCSYAGKLALFSGAFDERIALTISQESGGGGYTTWRFSQTLSGVETLGKTDHNWFKEDMFQFADAVSKLPEDHHELMAMVAPRALLVTGNPDYQWLADESGYVGSKAAQKVYDALGVPDRFGFSIIGGHTHCVVPDSQIPEIEAFVDRFLLDKDSVNTNIATTPYNTNLSPWITWTTPSLVNGSSYFGKTSLASPPDLQREVDTTVTFIWNKVEDAEKYYFQLSQSPSFTDTLISDSTTDTVKTINNLSKGQKYYWRVQVKNISGDSGPWSNQFNFITATPLPVAPGLVSATPYANRTDYIKLTWNAVEYASQYLVQISEEKNFATITSSGTTKNTVKALNGTVEGQKYYWRVQAQNVSGAGPWSEVLNFTIILPPTGLELQNSGLNEITLTWEDNSSVEDGYIIERKHNQDTVFTVIDSLQGSGNTYTDKKADLGGTYTYRVQAFKDSAVSDYSNEASLNLTGVDDEERVPAKYLLDQNYPNPFNPTTKIKFALTKPAPTKITVYDLLGREMLTLINKKMEAGYHEINFDATRLPSGIYFYKIQSAGFIQTRKMVLTK